MATSSTHTVLCNLNLLSHFCTEAVSTFMYLWNRHQTKVIKGLIPYEYFYSTKPDIGHMHTFGCVVQVTPPKETLGKLDDQGAGPDGVHI